MSQVRVLLQLGKRQQFWNEARKGALKSRLVGLGLGAGDVLGGAGSTAGQVDISRFQSDFLESSIVWLMRRPGRSVCGGIPARGLPRSPCLWLIG